MLSPDEMAAMRDTAEEDLPDICRIIDRVRATTDAGGTTYSESEGSPVRCRLSYMTGSERLVSDQMKLDAEFRLTLEREAQIREDSLVVMEDGRRFSVVHVLTRGKRQILPVALVRKVR
jgi:hypothetical protein